ncbi:MAG: response regulator [Elusimicrobia bacterium]|nr:response regulator [Elusimicrobiota bacterium]
MIRILLADDNEQNLYMLEFLLKKRGCEVSLSRNGAEALEAARRSPPDLVITDILMPVMDGFALCRQWTGDPKLRDIPFVFYSATYTDQKDIDFGLSLGADRFIVKPEEPEKLVATLQSVIEDSRAGRLRRTAKPRPEEKSYYQQYNQVLVNRLEAKMLQLEQALAEQRFSDEKIRKLNESLADQVALRTAELEEANKELESFTYSVSHDLKAPLRAIDGFAGILEEEHARSLDDEAKRLLRTIRKNVAAMRRLIDDLLGFSHLSSHKLVSSAIDMSASAQAVWEELKCGCGGRKVELVIQDLPPAQGDPSLIRQVLANLISNAVKFTAGREPARIEVGGEKDQGFNRYYVKDNGAGFDMANADRLFGVFQRLHRADEFEGTGVGLAIVKRIVQRHGGRVWAQAQPEAGAAFFFTLRSDEPGNS